MFEKIKSKIVNANLSTRLAVSGGVSSLSLLGGNFVSADTTVLENISSSINSGISAGVTSFETTFGSVFASQAPGIMKVVSLVVVAFGVLGFGKRLLKKAF